MIIVRSSPYGPVLFDRSGQAIYLFDLEEDAEPACYGDCAEAWPPVLTEGRPRGAGRVQDDLLGTTRRRNGDRQVTYAGRPLYFYANEGKREVLCHDIEGFGGTWFALQPDGTRAPT
jgi:predicted lipoprotein with Yx(FWY)xxD motif